MDFKVAVIGGDGIGPEIVAEAKKVLNRVAEKFGHEFQRLLKNIIITFPIKIF